MQRISVLIFLVIALSACIQQEVNLEKHGGIIATIKENTNEHNQILVISNIDKDDIINKSNEVVIDWNGDQEDSEPPQRSAESIDIVTE